MMNRHRCLLLRYRALNRSIISIDCEAYDAKSHDSIVIGRLNAVAEIAGSASTTSCVMHRRHAASPPFLWRDVGLRLSIFGLDRLSLSITSPAFFTNYFCLRPRPAKKPWRIANRDCAAPVSSRQEIFHQYLIER